MEPEPVKTGDPGLDRVLDTLARVLEVAFSPKGVAFILAVKMPESSNVVSVMNVDEEMKREIGLSLCEGVDTAFADDLGGGELVFKLGVVEQGEELVSGHSTKKGITRENVQALQVILRATADELTEFEARQENVN